MHAYRLLLGVYRPAAHAIARVFLVYPMMAPYEEQHGRYGNLVYSQAGAGGVNAAAIGVKMDEYLHITEGVH